MKMGKHLAFLCTLFVLGSCSKESIGETEVVSAKSAQAVERELLAAVNAHRTDIGLSPLEYSAVAYKFAGEHNDYMIVKGDLNHDNFSARASDIAKLVGADYVAENVAKDYPNAQLALQGWLKSADHRNTMEGDFSHTAVSVKIDSQGNYYYTQLFLMQSK